jgi:hypothetical protein
MYILTKKVGVFMFVIVSKNNNSIHREPNKKSYANTQYKNEAAAKAGITRTLKYYAKAIEDVNSVVAEGKKKYASRLYNAYEEATNKDLGRTYVAEKSNYMVMSVEDYDLIEPMIERTNMMTGKKFMEPINTPHYMSPSSESYWSA